ncbi:chorismate mutase family protein [Bacillus cereus]|uniref:Chorismate mutase family protein n=1 Tax=Bacillus cereus TaxID=1396 RepID=A0A9W7Q2G6_BACCE|nr:chorismate mutase family protein [Bacillus cereus]KAA6459465.1 chorismate mutase family protein [Bacillus cereus]KAB2502435.1 chorismate mutase family protein [Bacillus cereus]
MLSQQENELENLRAQLDKIDEGLLDTLKARVECCVQIALYKREHNIPMMQPNRINFVQDRAACYALKNGLSESFLRSIYDLTITETCRIEDLVIENPQFTNQGQSIKSIMTEIQANKKKEHY